MQRRSASIVDLRSLTVHSSTASTAWIEEPKSGAASRQATCGVHLLYRTAVTDPFSAFTDHITGVMVPDITTARLRINALEAGDAEALFNCRTHPDVAKYQSWAPSSVADAESFILRKASEPFNKPDTWYQLAIRLPTGELAGDFGLHFVDEHQVEIGFTIAPAHQRKGYGKEAVVRILEYLFSIDKHRVFGSVDPRNTASMTLLGRLMRQEAHFRKSILERGEWVDDVIFAVLREEWKSPSSSS